MRKIQAAILTAIIISLAWTPVFGQSLENLQKIAFENRDLVKRSQADLDIRMEKEKESRGEFLPSLDLGYTLNRLNHETVLGEKRENDAATAKASLNLFAGFKDYYTLKAARSLTQSSRFMLSSVRQDISLNVALRYLDVYRALENLKVAENEVKLYEDRLRQIDLKVKVGILKKTDLLKVKVEMDNAVQKRRRTQSEVEANINLLEFEARTSIAKEDLDFSLFDQLPGQKNYKDYETMILERQSELNALRMALEASGMKIEASRASLYPKADFSLSYSSHTRDEYFPDSFENSDDEVRGQIMVSMNIFDGMKKYSKTKQARLEQRQIRFDIAELEASLKTSLKNTLLNLDVAFDNLKVAKAGTAEALENMRVADLALGQGIGTSSDVLDAIFNLSRARFNLVSAYTEVYGNDFMLKRLVESF